MSTPTIIRCKLSEIRVDGNTQPRAGLSESTVQEYAQAMMAGDEFPKMVCFWDGSSRLLASGFHRYFAHQAAGSVEVEVEQYTGTRRDALLFAVGTNYDHGLRPSTEDKRKAVRLLLEDAEWSEWSDRRIASVTHTSHGFVAKIRAELAGVSGNATSEAAATGNATSEAGPVSGNDTSEPPAKGRRYVTKHGTEATMNTAKIGRSKPDAEPATGNATSEDDGPDAAQLLDEMQADLRKAEARVAELEKALADDGKEAVVKLSQRLEHAERRQAELMEDARRWQDRAERYERLLARCGKAVGDRDLDNVAPKVEAMARTLRDSKVAA